MSFRPPARQLAAVLSWVFLDGVEAAPTYTLLDLGPGIARDINLAGRIVGEAANGAWQWSGGNRSTIRFGAHFLDATPDQLLFFTALSANAINNSGRIVGSVMFIPQDPSTRMAYVFEGGDVATLVTDGDAFGVNNPGAVVGAAGQGFLFTGSTVTHAPGPSARLLAVNDAGVSAGSVTRNGTEEAATFRGDTYTVLDLSPLALPPPGPGEQQASAGRSINNAGQVVGSVQLRSPAGTMLQERAFLHANGTTTGLGTLGGSSTSARDINGDGVIIGAATVADGTSRAFVHANGTLTDLNALVVGAYGWRLLSANAVNDHGLIVGEGLLDGAQHAFVLRPTANALPPATVGPATNPEPRLEVAMHAGITIHGAPGQRVRVLVAGDASDAEWEPLATVTLEADRVLWIDPDAAARSHRVYRAVLVP